MVVAVEARKFSLPYLSLSSPKVTSFLYDPNSLSLALMHSDSTFSLFPSFSPFSISNLPPPQTLIPPPSSSACFVPLNSNPNPKIVDGVLPEDDKRVVFVAAGPYNGGSRVVLRFYLLGFDGKFVNVPQVVCSQNGVSFDRKLGVIVDVSHGMKVMISGSINYLALYSASGGKVWVFGVKLIGDGRSLRLVKCAVIDCRFPISSICLSFGFLILGEMRGVRVFPLRVLVKGRVGSKRRLRVARGKGENSNAEEREVSVKAEGRNSTVPNGGMKLVDESNEIDKSIGNLSLSKVLPNGYGNSVLDGVSSSSYSDGTVKPRSLKFRQDSGEWGMQFFLFNDYVLEGVSFKLMPYKKTKAISIQAISKEKFLILDSNGVVHVLHVSNSGSSRMRQLSCTIQVQHLAAFPDASADSPSLWMSDGLNSVHVMVIPNSDTTEEENDMSNNEGEIIQSSVTQVIFTSESVQDMVPLAANRFLVLGQDSVCAYGIS
ncbi:uncharacterized protein LOC110724844 isoform X1 [Chenopodium quinoa]|uniref:uncharacterized protein LOC110724844 isoform X1 n=1 Tax=Chenopodium quinoa TaxID=63459 RepID=UPI000B76D114|nr:uncharacterized protein LOC110724844 isoform X1 [Chenopodium quinoa]